MEKCDQIRILLREKGMSQKDLSVLLDIPNTTLSYYLTNKNKNPIPSNILNKIEKVLNFKFDKQEENKTQATEEEGTILKFLKLKPEFKEIAIKLIDLLLKTQENNEI